LEEERTGESEDQGFLPPEPAGPEPELGDRPQPPPPPQPAQTYGYPPPQATAYGYQPPPPQPQWGYPQQSVPDNGPAVAGFVFSLVAGSLLIISAGFSTIVSIACAIVGIVYSRKGKKKVDAGETPKHRGMAQAGVIIGWVSLVLSILATIAWSLVLAFAIADDDFDLDTEPNTVRVTAAALLAGARIIGG
jgi:hypothetical protein